jgi:hypothetical protein
LIPLQSHLTTAIQGNSGTIKEMIAGTAMMTGTREEMIVPKGVCEGSLIIDELDETDQALGVMTRE